ncbi:dihydrolipoamide acetyltransferase family protein [Alcaligenaceae bacterium C4P045]|nr:dihydrolipoamide acetyltransferase family protein [Alcaligenaceae bacterium C4P045]
MGIHIIKMPDIGEGIAEVELAGWHVKVGDVVAEDQPLADVMTDKATVEIPSPVVGTVVSLGGQEGDVMAVGGELIRLEVEGAGNQKGGAAAAGGGSAHAGSADAGSQAAGAGQQAGAAGGATSRASASGSGNRATSSDDDEGDADHMATNAPVDVPAADSVAADGIVAEGATSNGGAVKGGSTKSAKAASASSVSGSSSTSSSRADSSALSSHASSSASHTASSGASSSSAKPVERHEPADVHALNAKSAASPAVRKRARDLGIDLPDIQGSGPAGRIQHEDLDAHLLAARETQAASASGSSSGRIGSSSSNAGPGSTGRSQAGQSAAASGSAGASTRGNTGSSSTPRSTAEVRSYADEDFMHDRYEQRHDEHQVPVIGLRRKIAQKMVESKTRIPHYSYVEEIDVTDLETLRAQLNQKWGEKRGKLTILPFLIRAIVMALPDFPQINARFDDDAGVVTRFGAVHLGVAAQSDAGLMVPVIRHAESRDMWSLASEITRLAQAVRSGSVRREEMSGSTITVTSLGALGGIVTTPVINHPEVGIVGVNRIVERPMYRHGVVVPRKLMNLSSSFDHRVVDGMDAAEFIQAVRALLEQPAMLFVD